VCRAPAAVPRLHKAGVAILACASCGPAFWQPDGGRVALTTGDVGSLAAHGLRIERIRAEGARYPLGYLFERLRKTLTRRGAAPARWPGAGLSIPVNLFDVMTVHAVREAA